MTDEMFGVITTVNAERVWRCNQPSRVSQTETSKRRSQSFCVSVFLQPASLSWQHLWASITHPRQSVMCVVTIFICNQNTSCVWVWFSIFVARHCQGVPVLSISDVPPRSEDEGLCWCCCSKNHLIRPHWHWAKHQLIPGCCLQWVNSLLGQMSHGNMTLANLIFFQCSHLSLSK